MRFCSITPPKRPSPLLCHCFPVPLYSPALFSSLGLSSSLSFVTCAHSLSFPPVVFSIPSSRPVLLAMLENLFGACMPSPVPMTRPPFPQNFHPPIHPLLTVPCIRSLHVRFRGIVRYQDPTAFCVWEPACIFLAGAFLIISLRYVVLLVPVLGGF